VRSFIRNRVLAGAIFVGVVVLEALALRAGIPARRLRQEAQRRRREEKEKLGW
jgi:hypothetical protein